MLVLPVARPAQADLRPRHVTGKNALEGSGRDVLRHTQRRRPLAVPEARPPVPGVVLDVVALRLEIRDRHGRRAEIAQTRDQPSAPGRRSSAAAPAPISAKRRRSCIAPEPGRCGSPAQPRPTLRRRGTRAGWGCVCSSRARRARSGAPRRARARTAERQIAGTGGSFGAIALVSAGSFEIRNIRTSIRSVEATRVRIRSK